METKTCSRCRQTHPHDQFYKCRKHNDGLTSYCKSCVLETTSATQKANRVRYNGYTRKHKLKSCYGITLEEYDRMCAEQGGVCAICGQPEKALFRGKPRVLSVDHDHTTGEVRGLLCGTCNRGVGNLKDDPDTIAAAREYILRHKKRGR